MTPRDRGVMRVLGITLALNWLVSLAKIVVGILGGSLTVVADGLHSLLDGANNVLGMGAIWLSAKPPDREHPYGHRKFENVAAMMIGGLIVLIAWELTDNLLRTTYAHFKGTAPPFEARPVNFLHVGVVAVTMVINLLVARYEYKRGEELGSTLLKADSTHTYSDSLVSGLSLASLIVGHLAWWIDPLLTVGVLFFLGRAAWGIINENIPAFTDHVRLDPAEVQLVVDKVPGVRSSDNIRSHGSERDIHLDLSIVVEEHLNAAEVERVEQAVRATLQEEFPSLTFVGIHHRVEP